MPRASLLWKPRPAFRKYSVSAQGPSTTVSFGPRDRVARVAGVGGEVAVDVEVEVVEAHAELGAQPVVPALVVRDVGRVAGLRARRPRGPSRAARAASCRYSADGLDVVAAQLDAGAQRARAAGAERQAGRRSEAPAVHAPVVVLLELVAVVLVERVGEVRDQVEVVVDAVGVRRSSPPSSCATRRRRTGCSGAIHRRWSRPRSARCRRDLPRQLDARRSGIWSVLFQLPS